MKTTMLLRQIAKFYPKRLAEPHDHVGLMTGKLPLHANKIILCLDLDWQILNKIKEIKPDIIFTHHPFIFGTKHKVFQYDLSKKELCNEIDKLNIPVYSFHTNFDSGFKGMNDALCDVLGLVNVKSPEKDRMMRIGELPIEMDVFTFSTFAKKKMDVNYGLLIHEGHPMIKKVGIIAGGGSRSWNIAKEEGCDIYISGDAPHHVRRDIVNAKFNYLDLPHEIEKIFMPAMKRILLNIDNSLEIFIIDHEKLPNVI